MSGAIHLVPPGQQQQEAGGDPELALFLQQARPSPRLGLGLGLGLGVWVG